MEKTINDQFNDYLSSKYGLNGASFTSQQGMEDKTEVGYRFEGTTQDKNLTDSISMRVYDPLWMLCRQWQLGEFRGNDAGTAMSVKYTYGTTDINCGNGPMEPYVEQINHRISPMVRVESALYLFDSLKSAFKDVETKEILALLKTAFPLRDDSFLESPIEDGDIKQCTETYNKQLNIFNRAFVKKAFDGFAAYIAIVYFRNFEELFSPLGAKYVFESREIGTNYVQWFEKKYLPDGLSARELRKYEQDVYRYNISTNIKKFIDYIQKKYEIRNKKELLNELSLEYPTIGSLDSCFDLETCLTDENFVKMLSPYLREKHPETIYLKSADCYSKAHEHYKTLKEEGKGVEPLSRLIGGIHLIPGIIARLENRMEQLSAYIHEYKGMVKHIDYHLYGTVKTMNFDKILAKFTLNHHIKLNNYFFHIVEKIGLGRHSENIMQALLRICELPERRYEGGPQLIDTCALYRNIVMSGLYSIFTKLGLYFAPRTIEELETAFMSKMDHVIKGLQSNWNDNQLGYDYEMIVGNRRYIAKDYNSGQLSWYNFDVQYNVCDILPNKTVTKYAIPTLATYASAPNKRLWQFENHKVFLGNSTEMQSKGNIAMLQYTTMYGNDWMMFPIQIEIGKHISLKEIVVYDTFGQKTVIQNNDMAGIHDRNVTSYGNRWQMYNNAFTQIEKGNQVESGLFFPPSLIFKQESETVEEVQLLRDEMANMVWAVEKKTENGCGGSVDLEELNSQLSAMVDERNQQTIAAKTSIGFEGAADVNKMGNNQVIDRNKVVTDRNVEETYKYYLQTHVPFNWIPLTVQHTSYDSLFSLGGRSNVFRRAKMPVFLDGFKAVHPVTSIMRKGIYSKTEYPLYINEEEVQQVGTMVTKNYQRTRWINGAIYSWVGYEKQLKNMQANSNLLFDALCKEESEKKVSNSLNCQ